MRKWIGANLGAIGTTLWLSVEMLLGVFGARAVIESTAPVVAALLPALGFGLLCGALAHAVVFAWRVDREYGETIARELRGTVPSQHGLHDAERVEVLRDKYRKWLGVGRSDSRARRYAAIFEVYGYARGRRKVWAEARRDRR